MPRKKCETNKADICEDFCFYCKDGGFLMVCDYRDCLKAYHPDCVGKDDSFVETGERWTCNWHSCFLCHKSVKFQCLCCPQAVCSCCILDVDFACVRGNKGFCNHCLKLALFIDEGRDVDSDGGKVDFNDRDTYEFYFKEYLKIIMVEEGLTWENVRSTTNSLKNSKNSKCDFDSNEISKMEENTGESEEESHLVLSDNDHSEDTEEYEPVGDKKMSKKKLVMRKRKVKSKKIEFNGWGSKALFEFLSSIGRGTTKELSQYEVTTIVTDYCKGNKLFHPERKKRVLCDARLQSLLGRKSLSKNSIYNLLENHFAENYEQSEEEEFGSCSEHDEDLLGVCKRQRKLSTLREPQKSKVTEDLRTSCFASITAENIKLVYLKRSLVEELLKQPETFDTKVVGSFVRVKSDPNDYLQRYSHQLLQVIGVNTLRNCEMNDEILLELSSLPKNVPISKLSDDNFSEEECGDLHDRIKTGVLKKITVVELEQKARSLHEDITNHWIKRELALLQKHIDRANEKGWRRELSVYIEKRLLLQSHSEQSRLVNEIPEVIADIEEPEPAFEDSSGKVKQGPGSFPESPIGWASQTPSSLDSETFSCPNGKTDAAVAPEMKNDCNVSLSGVENQSEGLVAIQLPQRSRIHAYEVQGDILRRKLYESASKKKNSRSNSLLTEELQRKSLPFAYESPPNVTHQQKHQFTSDIGDKGQPSNIQEGEVKNKSGKTVELTGPSGDDRDRKVAHENLTCAIWHIIDPHDGEIMGPYSMSMLKQWSDMISCELKYKVCKTGQGQEDAIFLTDAIDQFDSDIGGKGQDEAIGIKKGDVKGKSSKMIELIELSDDDEDCKVANENPTWAVWQLVGPRGEIMGPHSLSALKRWSESSPQELKSKVWKVSQSQKEAIFLSDAISQVFSNS